MASTRRNSRSRSSPVPAENTAAAYWSHPSVANGVRPVSRSTVHVLQGRTSSTKGTVSPAPSANETLHALIHIRQHTGCSRARQGLFLPLFCPSPTGQTSTSAEMNANVEMNIACKGNSPFCSLQLSAQHRNRSVRRGLGACRLRCRAHERRLTCTAVSAAWIIAI